MLLLSCCNVFSQELSKDSVLSLLASHIEKDTMRVKLLIEASNLLLHEVPDEALKYIDESITIAEQQKWKSGLATALRQKGNIYYYMDNFVKALDLYLEALRISEETNQKSLALSLYNNLGNVYADIKDHDKALRNYQIVLDAAIQNNDTVNIIRSYSNIGNVKNEVRNMDSAIEYFRKALELSKLIKNEFFQAAVINNLGISYRHKKEYDVAINYFIEAATIAEKINNKYIKTAAYNSIANISLSQKYFDKAQIYADSALSMAQSIDAVVWQTEAWEVLYQVYQHQKKHELALRAYQNYDILYDSVLTEEKKAVLTKKEMQYQLEKQDLIAKSEIKRQAYVKNTAIIASILLLVFSAIGYLLYKKKRDEKQLKEIANFKANVAETKLQALRSQMNPHFIFNSLNSISDYLDKNDIEKADEYLAKFSRLTRSILENSEKKWVTIKEDVELLKLYIEIESLRLTKKLSYNFRIDDEIDIQNTLLPPLLLQPLIENSIWHGISQKEGDGHILVEIIKNNQQLICAVEDNGIGIKNKDILKESSMGLTITRQRIEITNSLKKVKGSINYIDKPEGLRVELILPLELKF